MIKFTNNEVSTELYLSRQRRQEEVFTRALQLARASLVMMEEHLKTCPAVTDAEKRDTLIVRNIVKQNATKNFAQAEFQIDELMHAVESITVLLNGR